MGAVEEALPTALESFFSRVRPVSYPDERDKALCAVQSICR